MARTDRYAKKKTRLKPRFFLILFLALLILGVLAAVLILPALRSHEPAEPVVIDDPVSETPPPDEIVSLSILCAGDAMVHESQWRSAAKSDGTYDFTAPFRYIKPYVEEADLAIVNVETTFAGDAPSGYPSFCAPDEFAAALGWTGFDIANTCNNHTYDKRLKGVTRTLSVLRDTGLATVGTHYTWEDAYTVYDVNGLRVGIVAATYETKTGTASHALNGISVADDAFPLINTFRSTDYSFDESTYRADLARITGEMRSAREDGADIVVCFMHWGKEYNLLPDDAQKQMAQDLADAGADVIFGSHTHVPQSADVLVSASTGNSVPVFYSLGNLISNQRRETLPTTPNNVNTEETILARVTLTYNKTQGKVEAAASDAIPCWLDKWYAGGKQNYALIPLVSGFETNASLTESGLLSYAKDALERIRSVVGEQYIYE